MPKPETINAIVFYVEDSRSTEEFYSRIGFAVTKAGKGHIRITLDAIELEFHDERAESIPEFILEAGRRPKGAGIYFYFRVPELELFHQSLINNGVAVKSGITERPWGNLEIIVSDPDGYNLVFYQKKVSI